MPRWLTSLLARRRLSTVYGPAAMAALSALTRSSRTSGASVTALAAAIIERALSEIVTASGWRAAAGVLTPAVAALPRTAVAAIAARRRSCPLSCEIVDMAGVPPGSAPVCAGACGLRRLCELQSRYGTRRRFQQLTHTIQRKVNIGEIVGVAKPDEAFAVVA